MRPATTNLPMSTLLRAGLMMAAASSWRDTRADEPRPSGWVQVANTRQLSPGGDASALIRWTWGREAWVDRIESLSLKGDVVYEMTPAGIAKRRHKLEQQGRARDVEESRGLRPRTTRTIVFAFDRNRLRSWDYEDPDWFALRVWDGRRLMVHVSYDTPLDRREYRISDGPAGMASGTLGYFGFHAGPHRFWWDDQPEEDRKAMARLMGKPEDYTYGGRASFHGTECHVVSRWANWTTFYIAVADGRLCGSKEGAQKVPDKRLVNWLNRKGHAFQSTEELWAWIKSRTPEEAIALEREESANLPRLVDPCWEYRLSDYREVAPGCWLPMTQVRDLYCLDEDDRLVVEETYRLKITEVKVDAPLPDALFRVEIPEGSKVNDQTKAPRKGKP